jgi:hypothetical protein
MGERERQKTEDVDIEGTSDVSLDESSDLGLDEDTDLGLDDTVGDSSLDSSADTGLGGTAGRREDSAQQSESGGLLQSLYGRTVGRVLSTRSLGITLVVTFVFSMLFSLIPLIGLLGKLLGIGVAGFLYGLVGSSSRYPEHLLAGSIVGGGSALLGNLLVIGFGSMTGLLVVGVLGGALTATVGHYFGRDMNEGITRDIG